MSASGKPWWQQATAVVTVSAGGVLTGMSFVPGTAADLASPVSLPVHLLALEQSARLVNRRVGPGRPMRLAT